MRRLYGLVYQIVGAVLLFQLMACGAARVNLKTLPKGVKIHKSAKVPNDVALAIYIPESMLKANFFMEYSGRRVEPGKALGNSIMAVASNYFPDTQLLDLNSERKFGLFLDLDPEWDFVGGKTILKLKYRLLDTHQNVILESEKEYKANIEYQDPTVSFYNASARAAQLMFVDILNKMKPSAEKYAAVNPVSMIDPLSIVNLEKPISSGTAFNINENGEMLTAAHVIKSCLIVKAKVNDKMYDVKLVESNNLLDLAVLSADRKNSNYLDFRNSKELNLGEKISTVSFPLKGLLDASANVTIGNISSKKALAGSLGLFQFSAPIQPGSSGGAVVSEKGEVLGVVTSTLNITALIKKGVVPQNINFALDSKYVQMFLDKNKVRYHIYKGKKAKPSGIEAALASTVQLTCYQ